MPFDKLPWSDGQAGATPLTAARGPNRWEDGIKANAGVVDALNDSVAALTARSSITQKVQSGTSVQRGAVQPIAGDIWFDTTLGYPVWGNGTAWVKSDGTSLTGGGVVGASNAPQNFTAVTQPDGSIIVAWNAVAGAASYKLYETTSLSGVTGATALTTTSSTRTPSTQRTYEYWVTALVSGVESAASNHAQATLPYVAGGGPPPSNAGSPAALLNLGGVGGYFNEGIGYSTGHIDYPYSDLIAGKSWPPYFMLNATNTAVQFLVYMDGAKTSINTNYARSEMRELTSDGVTKAAWNAGSGTHIMEYTFRVNHVQPNKPWVTVGQIHDSVSDAISIKIKGSTTSTLDVVAALYGSDQTPKLVTGYSIGQAATIRIELINGTLKLYANSVLMITTTAMSGKGVGHYFKLGSYPQSHNDYGGFDASSEYGSVDVWGLTVTHSPAL